MKIAFFYGHGLSGVLTRIFTGSDCYHVAIVDEESGHLYDMNLLIRRRVWPDEYAGHKFKLVESPVPIKREFLEHLLDTDNNTYGWRDYCLFALRPIYHLFGKSTRNAGGVICSEFVYNILVANGWPVRFSEVASPADLERELLK